MGTPFWKTWKPYAIIVAVAVVGSWWWNAMSPYATLKAGEYDCVAVYVNREGKFQLLVDGNQSFTGYARVESGVVTSYSTPNVLGWSSGRSTTVRSKGTKNFHATQDPASHSYEALACEWAKP